MPLKVVLSFSDMALGESPRLAIAGGVFTVTFTAELLESPSLSFTVTPTLKVPELL